MILIAIDPDVDGCGVATMYCDGSLYLDRMQLHDLFDYIKGQALDIKKNARGGHYRSRMDRHKKQVLARWR